MKAATKLAQDKLHLPKDALRKCWTCGRYMRVAMHPKHERCRPGSRICWRCEAHHELGLTADSIDVLRMAMELLLELEHAPSCYHEKYSQQPQGYRPRMFRHGCTCGLSRLVDIAAELRLGKPPDGEKREIEPRLEAWVAEYRRWLNKGKPRRRS